MSAIRFVVMDVRAPGRLRSRASCVMSAVLGFAIDVRDLVCRHGCPRSRTSAIYGFVCDVRGPGLRD